MLKRNSKDQMLVQRPESNDITVLDEQDFVKGRSTGRSEPGPINEDYHHYRHSLDDRYTLWRNGPRDLDIYDCELLRVDETVPNFWTYNGAGCEPIAAVSNREVSKILGLSQLKDSTQIFHYYAKDQNNKINVTTYKVKDFFPTSRSFLLVLDITTMEVSGNGEFVYLAGREVFPGQPVVYFNHRMFRMFSKPSLIHLCN
jgi:hypothetical protein